jgi:hypothetical protein
MTLMQCMEVIRYNQKHPMQKTQRLVPFRDTKLTRLFQVLYNGVWCHRDSELGCKCGLSGNLARPSSTLFVQENLTGLGSGSTVMIVNVGPSPNDFDETVHALKYGALAKEITIAPPRVDSRCVVPRRKGMSN